MTCDKCKHHILAGYRFVPDSIPACDAIGEYRELPSVRVPTKEGGFDRVWNNVTPEWCPC